ncbi:MAG TPA: hypothetical protein VH436_32865 [Vicinamibacterales bacterium]
MDMLLGFIRIVPLDFGLETAGLRIEVHRGELGAHNSFERVHDRPGPQPVQRIGPSSAIAKAHRVVIAIRETKPHEQAPRRFGPERIHQFLSQQAHGCRAKDDDSLLMEPDDALIRPKVEELGEVQATLVHPFTILL